MSRPAIQQFAGHYIHNVGFAVVPLEPREKKCLAPEWPTTTFRLDHFRADHNIGIRLGDGLVMLDDDFDDVNTKAVDCMDDFVSPTRATYGRGPFRKRKRLYRCHELTEPITYTDIDGRHLLQLRVGAGLQDMAPPSIHPNGERLKWDGLLLPPPEVDAAQLTTAVRHAWTARLIAKYWPTHTRHSCRLAWSRFLLEQIGMSREVTMKVVEWASRLGGSDAHGIADVRRAVLDTEQRLQRGEPATGAATIASLLPQGRRLLQLLRKAYGKGEPVLDEIERLNETFAIISVGTKVVVLENFPDGGIKKLAIWGVPQSADQRAGARRPEDQTAG
jgi:hypothetical protein